MKKVYYNGKIITMTEPLYCDAVLVEDGIITAVGDKSYVLSKAGVHTKEIELIDLKGYIMMPSFIDSHSHITAYADTLGMVNLEGTKNFEEIQERIKEHIDKVNPEKGQWIFGFGYDHNILDEKRHPDKIVLDSISEYNPILIAHRSGHMGVMNSLGLIETGINYETKDPDGGRIGRVDLSNEPNGYLEETAFTTLATKLPKPDMKMIAKQIRIAEKDYLSYGITTVQDGLTRENEWEKLRYMSEHNLLKLDTVCYIDIDGYKYIMNNNPEYQDKYINRLKIGGYKVILDGSPQGRTAWVTIPYEHGEEGYYAYPSYENEEVLDFINTAVNENKQILVHCNGDAAAQQMIDTYNFTLSNLNKDCHNHKDNIRPVMIHAQLLRRDQLESLKKLNIIASFFIAHTYYWGDIHLVNFGKNRASCISPAGSAIEKGVTYTFHQDTPVLPPNMLESVQCAVCRTTQNGVLLGGEERISPFNALKGVTINAAYQYFEENIKGSLKPGKLANMIILDNDPLKVPHDEIGKIKVLCTIREGEPIYIAK